MHRGNGILALPHHEPPLPAEHELAGPVRLHAAGITRPAAARGAVDNRRADDGRLDAGGVALPEVQHGFVDGAVGGFVREGGYFGQVRPVVPLFVVCNPHGWGVLVGEGEDAGTAGVD